MDDERPAGAAQGGSLTESEEAALKVGSGRAESAARHGREGPEVAVVTGGSGQRGRTTGGGAQLGKISGGGGGQQGGINRGRLGRITGEREPGAQDDGAADGAG
ncbi:MAG: hypothetical protein L0Z50_02070 [Verrucomicrobiales bacterium]|nr:hypothetical protein [Verrucomicrobiales bacterium]